MDWLIARTKIQPELSVRVKPFSLICVIVPSIVVTGGNPILLIGVVLAHPLTITTINAPKAKKIFFIVISPLLILPNGKLTRELASRVQRRVMRPFSTCLSNSPGVFASASPRV